MDFSAVDIRRVPQVTEYDDLRRRRIYDGTKKVEVVTPPRRTKKKDLKVGKIYYIMAMKMKIKEVYNRKKDKNVPKSFLKIILTNKKYWIERPSSLLRDLGRENWGVGDVGWVTYDSRLMKQIKRKEVEGDGKGKEKKEKENEKDKE